MCGVYVCVVCVHESINTRTDTAPVQQSNEYLFSLLLVSVQTLLVYEGSPPAFDAAAQEEWREKEKGKIGLHLVHLVVTGYNRLGSVALLPLHMHMPLTCCTSWSSYLRRASWSWYWDVCWCC